MDPNPWPHDDNAALIAFYGDPNSRTFPTNLLHVSAPWRMLYQDDHRHVYPIHQFLIHRKCQESILKIFGNLWKHVEINQNQDAIDHVGLQWFAGSYVPHRMVRGSLTKISCHNFGAALDLDPDHEPMNRNHINHWPQWVIDVFKAERVYWGGDFLGRQDPMHFQWAHE